MDFRIREYLPHQRPPWVDESDPLFITLCHQERKVRHFDNPTAWEAIASATNHLATRGKWTPLMMLAMPDHLHGIVLIPHTQCIQQTLGSFKRDIGYTLPTSWQRDAFDHRIRGYPHYLEIRDYIRANPVRAGLVKLSGDWPYSAEWPMRQDPC
jgi:REP element-mobilizing transposase RayT